MPQSVPLNETNDGIGGRAARHGPQFSVGEIVSEIQEDLSRVMAVGVHVEKVQ
jgi:hypothetical protein